MYADAFGFIRRNGLMRYFLYSGLVGLVIVLLMVFIIQMTYPALSSFFQSVSPFDFQLLGSISAVISIALISFIFIFIFKYLVLIITAPLMSVLSEKTEKIIIGEDDDGYDGNFINDLIRGLRINMRNIVREIGITIILLFLGLIPAINLFVTPMIYLVQSYYAGYGNFDFWAERHFTYRGTIEFMKDHRPMVAGNGVVFVFLLAVPVLGVFIAPPLATVASTIQGHRKLTKLNAH
jgi:CysZ protein